MNIFRPNGYQKDVYQINYKKLKTEGIKVIVFDLDNTLATYGEHEPTTKLKKFITELKKDFIVVILSNNYESRVEPFKRILNIPGYHMGAKPSFVKLKQIKNDLNVHKKDMVMIGDQILTDVLAGNRFRIKTILVDQLSQKDIKITSFNRRFERAIIKFLNKKSKFERGHYYE